MKEEEKKKKGEKGWKSKWNENEKRETMTLTLSKEK